MVTVCPLFAVTVAVAMVTTVCPAGMELTILFWPVLAIEVSAVLADVTPASPSTGSTNSRRRNPPVGGELYRSTSVVGEGETPAAGGGGALFSTHLYRMDGQMFGGIQTDAALTDTHLSWCCWS